MATRVTAWVPGATGLAIGAVVGFAAASLMKSDAIETSPSASARHSETGATALDSRIDEILERLRALEPAIRGRGEPANADAPAPTATPVRQEDGLRELIETRFKELEAEIRRTSAGVGELARLKPTPDVDAVTAYGREFTTDAERAIRRIQGITYRDALQEFGSPTLKVAAGEHIHGPSGGRITSWAWELPAGDLLLYIQFEAGIATWAGFGDSTRLKKYVTTLGN
jgi:hypothetical protein